MSLGQQKELARIERVLAALDNPEEADQAQYWASKSVLRAAAPSIVENRSQSGGYCWSMRSVSPALCCPLRGRAEKFSQS